MGSNAPARFKGKQNAANKTLHGDAHLRLELHGADQPDHSVSGCGSSTGTDTGQQAPAVTEEAKQGGSTVGKRPADDRFSTDGKRIERPATRPMLITPKTGPIISYKAGTTPWMTTETARGIENLGKRLADEGRLPAPPPRRPRLGPSPPSRHASLSDDASAITNASGSLQHAGEQDSPRTTQPRAVSGPSSSTSSGQPQPSSARIAGPGVTGPAGTAPFHGPGTVPVDHPLAPRVPQQPVPHTAPGHGRRDSQANAAHDPCFPTVNASGHTQATGQRGTDGSGSATLTALPARPNGPPGPVNSTLRGANANPQALVRAPVTIPPTTRPAQAPVPGHPPPASQGPRNGPPVRAQVPALGLPAPVASHQAAPRHAPAQLPAPVASTAAPPAAAPPSGPPTTPLMQYRCRACDATFPPGASQYKNALKHARTTHLGPLAWGLKAQAQAELQAMPGTSQTPVLRCKRCGRSFPPGQRQSIDAEAHVVDEHLPHVRDGLDEQAKTYLFTEPVPARRQ